MVRCDFAYINPKFFHISFQNDTFFNIPNGPKNKHLFLHIMPAKVLVIQAKIVIIQARGAYFRDYKVFVFKLYITSSNQVLLALLIFPNFLRITLTVPNLFNAFSLISHLSYPPSIHSAE